MRSLVCLLLLASVCPAQEAENYVFGFLRAHPERKTLPEAEAQAIQKAHLSHLDKMAKDGVLVGAGPLIESPDLRGVLIFRGLSIEQARQLASQDPAVINKRLHVHLENWTAQKGIGDGIAKAMKDPNYKFKMTRYGFVVSWLTPDSPKDWNNPEVKAKLNEHIEWMKANRSKFAAFGPFKDSKELLGVIVLRSTDLDAASALMKEEPFVRAGWVRPQLLTWMVAEGVMAAE
ncbi:MAG TPA: YciI family protein [Bryobacteraceae bacterium]|nr:YciI family protein [Bryobacteraceae bacterium]